VEEMYIHVAVVVIRVHNLSLCDNRVHDVCLCVVCRGSVISMYAII
jgi:hypothetical protein